MSSVFTGPTLRRPRVVPELQYPPGRVVEKTLRCWAISRWRGPVELARFFLRSCFWRLPVDAPPMFTIEEVRMGGSGLKVTFTNPYDAYNLLSQVFWCGCELTCFTAWNIFTDWDSTFPTANQMHCLPYVLPDDEE